MTPPRADVYRVLAGAHRAPLGRGGEASHDALRGRVDLLSPVEAAVVAACHGGATLDEHAARATAAGVPGTRAAIRGVLGDLVARGVLASDAEIARLLGSGASPSIDDAIRVSTLGIPTRERPRSLRRALESYARDIAEHGRAIEIVILDDASSDASSSASAAIARDVASRFAVPIRHIDRAAKHLFTSALAALSGAPPRIVEAALAPSANGLFAAGAGRNALLLDAVDEAAIQVDDDTVCDLRAPPGTRSALRARSFEDPADIWPDEPCSDDRAPGLAAVHEQLLGRGGASLLLGAMDRGDADLRDAGPALLGRLARGGRVRCTQLGVRGDSAMGTMVYLLTIGQPSRARLLASEAIYRRVVSSRRLARAVPSATVTELDGCMTLAIGLDARSPLPPFPPVWRNEDGLFGAVLGACDPTALFGHLPWTIAHEPEDERPQRFDLVFDQSGRVGVNDVIAGLVGASLHDIDHRTPAAAFESLGRALLAWTDLPEDDLFERLSWMLGRRLAQRLSRIAALLAESRREPAFWARDLDRLADVLRERVEDPERAVPYELIERLTLPAARAEAVRRVREYGEILLHWPSLWDAARTLRARGDRFGEVHR